MKARYKNEPELGQMRTVVEIIGNLLVVRREVYTTKFRRRCWRHVLRVSADTASEHNWIVHDNGVIWAVNAA
jgi:hypothetical protein